MTPAHALHFDAAPEASDFFFGNVFHAQMKNNRMDFAVKVMDQGFIRKESKTAFVLTERKVMSRLSHPNIVKFYCSFRDNHSLYLVMELCRGGDLFALISKEYQSQQEKGVTDAACSFELTQFYMAELVNTFEYMHSQMFTGRAPFVGENDYLTFQVIINHSSEDFEFPSSVPEAAQDLIRKLLVQDPDQRIGAQQNEEGYAELKVFFCYLCEDDHSSWSGRCKREFFLRPDTTVNEIDPHTFDVVSRTQEDASVQHHLLEIRAKLLACDEDADIVDAVNRMDQVVERCLELSEQEKQQQQSLDAVPVEETMKLLVALAGGQDGETFVLEDPMRLMAEGSTHTPFVNASKRIGDRIRMNDVELVQRSRTLFDKMPAPLEEEKWVVLDCSVPTAFSEC
ncbi:hypothetical protein BBJ29_001265 [Phytophthora kernoviae]|uniref:Protein kinase domain-containing protein n=1 Tax=Phytophthora kernoviae TaxID=325452 RepID=A0A3F2RUX7_9STRA|nr:hypothetical protein BBJ29_001265 [Phytophthora kernoviae]RLN63842.1 hypothetical protein BBP00_00003833 [Phytophthora kernoviae]